MCDRVDTCAVSQTSNDTILEIVGANDLLNKLVLNFQLIYLVECVTLSITGIIHEILLLVSK